MNDFEKILNGLPVPRPDADRKERAKYHALMAFKSQTPNSKLQENSKFQITNFKTILRFCGKAALIVSVGVVLAFLTSPRHTNPSGKMLAQIAQLFPDQLNAVIERDGDTRIILADRADPSLTVTQPLLVSLERRGEKINILSFSGRVVRFNLDGREISLETLLTAGGHVIVSDGDFLWSRENSNRLLGYNIQARPLMVKL
ncbi:MAG: hypothetical protein LBK60_01940 [Verrucomicrobiales bacterium]|jgi:hypothetical protein|nr:hypothetical protein [Verrucomicrobiales bacterium]